MSAESTKIAPLRKMLDERGLEHVLIEVDGGVKVDNVHEFAAADVLVSGSGIFKADDYAARIKEFRDLLDD